MSTDRPRLHAVPQPEPVDRGRWVHDDAAAADRYRVEVWVAGQDGNSPWLASAALVDTPQAARVHATQAVAGLVMDGIDPDLVFVGAIYGTVPAEDVDSVTPEWTPHPRERVHVTVIGDDNRLGLWVREPQDRWRARTGLDETAPALNPDRGDTSQEAL